MDTLLAFAILILVGAFIIGLVSSVFGASEDKFQEKAKLQKQILEEKIAKDDILMQMQLQRELDRPSMSGAEILIHIVMVLLTGGIWLFVLLFRFIYVVCNR